MPDVRMPDGTIIRNVPEGTTRAQLMARYGKAKPQAPARKGAASYGLADSISSGFLDEAGAVLDTLGIGGSGEERPNIWKGNSFGDAFRANQKRNSEILRATREANPGEFLTGQIGGALVPLPGGKRAAASAIAQRAKQALAGGGKAKAAVRVAASAAPDLARGAVYGAGSAEGGLAERARGAVSGTGQALAGHTAGRAVGGVVSRTFKGKQASPAVRELHEAGVVMTPGQRAGPGSIRKNLEEGVLGSLPVVKSIPNAAKRRGIEQLNVAAINRALEPIGFKLPKGAKPGRELIQKAGDAVYSAYDASVAPLSLGNDSGLKGASNAIRKGAKASVGQGEGQLLAIIDRVSGQLQKPIRGTQVRDLIADLRSDAANFTSSASANERNIGAELWKLHDHLSSALIRQNRGAAVKKFTKARDAVANFKRIEDAAAKSADGVFNPTQFRQAVTRRGYGTTTGKVARGEARLQSLADAAKQVLPDNLPNSGTPERAMAASLAAGGPGVMGLLNPYAGAAVGASTLPYVPGLDRLLQNLALNRPDLLVKLGIGAERATPALGTAGAMTSLSVNSQP